VLYVHRTDIDGDELSSSPTAEPNANITYQPRDRYLSVESALKRRDLFCQDLESVRREIAKALKTYSASDR
jgi:hypothetical protein